MAFDLNTPVTTETSCCNPWNSNRGPRRHGGIRAGNDVDLAKEMNDLSMEERGKVYDDIHGVAEVRDETPDFLEKCLVDMNHCISTSRHRALTRAMFLRPELETNRKFHLMFLRATHYNAKDATKRMAVYFDKKCELFGEENIVKKITISDLNEDDLIFFHSGFVMELPCSKDNTGRPVWCLNLSKMNWKRFTVMGLLRWFWYAVMCTLEDEDAQKKGFCGVEYFPGTSLLAPGLNSKMLELITKSQGVTECLPYRFTAVHICYDDPRIEFIVQMTRVGTSKETRLRQRAHFGSPIELEYALLSFGIRCQGLFQRSHFDGVPEDGPKFIAERSRIENEGAGMEMEEEARSGIVLYPKANDILIGRGMTYREYSGNQAWYRLIDAHLDRYQQSEDRFSKTCISIDVVKKTLEANHRFLQRIASGWLILDEVAARGKAAVAFRSRGRAASTSSSKTSAPRSGGWFSDSSNARIKRLRHDSSISD